MLDRAFRVARRRNLRRGFDLPTVCDQPAWLALQRAWARVSGRWDDLVAAGTSPALLFRQLVVQAQLLQLLEIQALALVSKKD
jgi:hypothetical protein